MSASAAGQSVSAPRSIAAARIQMTPGLALVYLMWFFTLFTPHRFIPSITGGGAIMQSFVALLFIPTLIVALQKGGVRALYLPFALFTALHAVNVPFAFNRGLAFAGFKNVVTLYILFAASVVYFDTPAKAIRLLKFFVASFIWYLAQGNLSSGRVSWHVTLANPDSFGTLSAIAMGFGFYAGMAAQTKRWRRLGFAAAALGALGIVTSFARGAVLAGAAVAGVIWLRSPRKFATLGAGLGAGVLLLVAVSVIYPEGEFWAELHSIFEEGTTSGTGEDRWVIWRAALMVFREHPILGVGAYNVGVIGSEIIPFGVLDLKYNDPSTLYNKALHNAYLQILSEEGIVGISLWLWMLVDFAKRTRLMRTARAQARWRQAGGAAFDLASISLALECAMVGFLCGAFFYNMTYRHWFFSLCALAVLITEGLKSPATARLARDRESTLAASAASAAAKSR